MADLPRDSPAEIPSVFYSVNSPRLSKSDEQQQQQSVFPHGGLAADIAADCDKIKRRTQQKSCCAGNDCQLPLTQVEERQKFSFGLITKQDGNYMENLWSRKFPVEGKTKVCETPRDHDAAVVASAVAHVDVGTCNTQLGNLCVNARKDRSYEEGELEVFLSKMVTEGKAFHADGERNADDRQKERSVSQKQTVWNMGEDPEFAIENSSWPTLAEARNAKPIHSYSPQAHNLQLRSSGSDKETCPVPFPPPRVPISKASLQERTVETIKHTNANILASKSKSSCKRGGFDKATFSVTEDLHIHPMDVQVPSANLFVPGHSAKGNGMMKINTHVTGLHQAPAYGPFYYPRAESLALFPHNPAVPLISGREHSGWFCRGYVDVMPRHTGFIPPYDQQHWGPRYACPPVTPFMNMNVLPCNYSSYQGDISYVPRAPSFCFNHATPHHRPPGPTEGMVHAAPVDLFTLQEMLQNQIEYYFSMENLCHDTFLRSKMNDEGFVPLSLIATFPRVQRLTSNTLLILEALKNSTVVEVKNGKLRSYDWRRWKSAFSSTSEMQNNPVGPPNESMAEYMRVQENWELQDSQAGQMDDIHSLSKARGVAGSWSAPWIGVPAKVGAVNVPMAVTSIDSR